MSYQGTQCECGSPKRPRTEGCDRCQHIERVRLEGPSGKLYRALQREGEWMLATDIADMMDVDRSQASAALLRLATRGDIEQTWRKGVGMVYRATRRRAA